MQELNIIRPLNGLRAMAILLVLTWHYFTCLVPDGLSPFLQSLKFMTICSWSGVDLFFILSGFLIGRILVVNKQSPRYFKTFYLRRVFRIFPAYYLIVLAFTLVTASPLTMRLPWLTAHPFPLYAYLLNIQNFWMARADFGANWLGVTWSLAIEEQFYLLLPLLIYFLKERWLPAFLITGIVLAPVARAFLPGLGPYVLLPGRMDGLLLGVLIAHQYIKGNIGLWFGQKQKLLAAGILLTFAASFILTWQPGGGAIGGVLVHSLLGLLYGQLLVLAIISPPQSRLYKTLSCQPLLFIAKLSFMIYLTHQIFSGLVHGLWLQQEPQINNGNDAMATGLALVLTLLFSSITYHTFEKRLMEFGKKFRY